MKRGRGRPKKDGLYNSYAGAPGTGGRLDPTNEMFLKTEDREGGPIDPITSFEENVNLLFSGKYPNGFSEHAMYSYLNQFAYSKTPEGNETETKMEDNTRRFNDITNEIL